MALKLLRGLTGAAAIAALLSAPVAAQAQSASVALTVDAGRPGPKIEPRHLRPVRRASRHRHLRRCLGRQGFPRSPTSGASAATSSRHCGRSRCRTSAGRAAASPMAITGATVSARSGRRAVNASWGGVIEPNSFGTHEFIDFVEQIGAEAFLSVNVGSGTVAGIRRLAGIPDRRQADGAGAGARGQRPSRPLQGQISRHRQ